MGTPHNWLLRDGGAVKPPPLLIPLFLVSPGSSLAIPPQSDLPYLPSPPLPLRVLTREAALLRKVGPPPT